MISLFDRTKDHVLIAINNSDLDEVTIESIIVDLKSKTRVSKLEIGSCINIGHVYGISVNEFFILSHRFFNDN